MKAPAEQTSGIVPFPFSPDAAKAAARALAEGWVMSYPTETSYALGGNALNEALVSEVFRLKGREGAKALLLLINGGRGARELVDEVDPAAEALMRSCWPGALTLVLRAGAGLPAHLRDAGGKVALRHSPHPVPAELLRIGGVPLIGTSANRSGRPSAHSATEVAEIFGTQVALTVDGGGAPGGAPSTLLDTTARPFRILRDGAVTAHTLRGVLAAEFPAAVPA